MMRNNIWTRANTQKVNVAPHIQPGFDYGFDDAVPAEMRKQLCDFMTWVEEHFALPVSLWVDFEYKHYLVSREGIRMGYLFYWSDVDTWPDFDDEDAIPMIRLPVRDERWTINEILASFIEGITDYYAWLCKTELSPEEKEQTVDTILGAYQEAKRGVQIIDYFHADNQPHWRAQIEANEWRAAKFLADLLTKNEFHNVVGKGTVFLLADGDKLVSFLTLTERDCIDAPEYTPWIGFVHTAPEYRGHRHIGKLIDHACAVAHEHGAARVYLGTDHVGLYEKYGFTYLENRVGTDGEDSRVYVRDVNVFCVEMLNESMLPALFDFERRLSEEEPGYYNWTEEENYQDKVRASFQTSQFENALSFVAMSEGRKIVGRIDASLIPSHFDGSIKCYLDWICVLKSWRHKGVAQRLMAALRAELKAHGIDTLVGLIAANEEAQRFYRGVQGAIIRDEGIWIEC